MTRVVVHLAGTPHEYVIDPETLRDVPTRPAELAGWLDLALDAPIPTDVIAERRYRTDVGVAARMLRDLELAEQQLYVAAELARRESRTSALRARIRLANVWHWQGRFAAAADEFDACVAAAGTPAERAFAHQHAGKCAYDMNEFDRAMGHFHAALRLRAEGAAPFDLTESSRIALDAADACRVALAVENEIGRLLPDVTRRIKAVLLSENLLTDRPRRLGPLVELRGLLLAAPVPIDLVTGMFAQDICPDIDDLVMTGWLDRFGHTITPSQRCVALLETVRSATSIALRELWGEPAAALARVGAVVCGAIGTSRGQIFDALATRDPCGSTALQLFDRCDALRHHRFDAYTAALRSVGLTPRSARTVPADDPVHHDVAAATNRAAARPYRPLSTVDRDGLVAELRRL